MLPGRRRSARCFAPSVASCALRARPGGRPGPGCARPFVEPDIPAGVWVQLVTGHGAPRLVLPPLEGALPAALLNSHCSRGTRLHCCRLPMIITGMLLHVISPGCDSSQLGSSTGQACGTHTVKLHDPLHGAALHQIRWSLRRHTVAAGAELLSRSEPLSSAIMGPLPPSLLVSEVDSQAAGSRPCTALLLLLLPSSTRPLAGPARSPRDQPISRSARTLACEPARGSAVHAGPPPLCKRRCGVCAAAPRRCQASAAHTSALI